MAKVVEAITCRVEVVGRPKESQHQPGSYYFPTLFLDESKSEDEAKIWKSLSQEEANQLRKGDRVSLVPAGKDKNRNDKHNIVKLESTPTKTAQAVQPARKQEQQVPESVDARRQKIRAYVGSMARLYAECYQASCEAMEDSGASEESIRCAASSVYISAVRKFGLE